MSYFLPGVCFVELQNHAASAGPSAAPHELRPQSPAVARRLRLNEPLHVGPGRLAAKLRGADQEAQDAATLGCKLQAAEVFRLQPTASDPDGADAGTAQGLIERPDFVGLIFGSQHDQRRIGDCVELPLSINDNENALLASRTGCGQGQGRAVPQIFDKRTEPQTALRQQAIQGRHPSGSQFSIWRAGLDLKPEGSNGFGELA
jgi:hypothetical protein